MLFATKNIKHLKYKYNLIKKKQYKSKFFDKKKTLNKKGEIIYRVELPDMEQITLIYLENSDADYRKSCKMKLIKNINFQTIKSQTFLFNNFLHFFFRWFLFIFSFC
jgi:hypothetical protein